MGNVINKKTVILQGEKNSCKIDRKEEIENIEILRVIGILTFYDGFYYRNYSIKRIAFSTEEGINHYRSKLDEKYISSVLERTDQYWIYIYVKNRKNPYVAKFSNLRHALMEKEAFLERWNCM